MSRSEQRIPKLRTRGRENRRRLLAEALRLLLESDAPALGPVKGERSLPEHLPLVARHIAEIREIPVEQVVTAARGNARRLFGP